jgi:hypothetical protein
MLRLWKTKADGGSQASGLGTKFEFDNMKSMKSMRA